MSDKSIKGTIGEHKVIVELLQEGYHVAKAVDPQCPFDLIAVSPIGKITLIDVKTVSRRKKKSTKIYRVSTPIQKKFRLTTGLNIELKMIN